MARDRLTTVGPKVLDEHTALISRWALATQVGDDRPASLLRQGKNGPSASLSCPQFEGTAAPVDVFEAELRDLARPEPQAGEAQNDRAIPLSARR